MRQTLCMSRTASPKRPLRKTYIRAWRNFRGLTQEDFADRLGVSHSTVSRIERGLLGYTQDFLEAAADALLCEPADLIMRDPTKPGAPWSIWDQLTPFKRDQAARMLAVLAEMPDEKVTPDGGPSPHPGERHTVPRHKRTAL